MAAIAIGAMLIFSEAGIQAFADEVQSNVVETNTHSATVTEGDTVNIKYWISVQGGGVDGQGGCNFGNNLSEGGKSTAKITLAYDTTVLSGPTSVTLTGCNEGNAKTVTFNAIASGDGRVTVSGVSDNDPGSGTYVKDGATVTITVEEDTPADTTAPVLTLPADKTVEATSADGAIVTYEATAEDAVDGSVPVSCSPESGSTFPLGETTVNCTATDAAGNPATGSFAVKVQDTITPVIQVTGTISDGQQFYFGDVPSAPTCTATDSGSGVTSAQCTVSGYGTKVGPQTLTFTATDNAGNTATQTIKYTVLAWTIKGFYQPVDMNGVENTVKGGSTAPLKFEVFKGTTELTATSAIVTPLEATKVTCDAGAPLDEIEALATGGTALRYDATGGQFIYNWQTPKQPGACYDVTVTTQTLHP